MIDKQRGERAGITGGQRGERQVEAKGDRQTERREGGYHWRSKR